MSDLKEYKCPNCGASLSFDSSLQKMKCPYCGTELDVEALTGYDADLQIEDTKDIPWRAAGGGSWQEGEEQGLRVYSCESCGGEIIADENTAATACPYCGSNVVITGNLSGSLKPDLVVPFQLDREAAVQALGKHLRGKKLLPKVFRTQNQIEKVQGVYVPFWFYGAEADARIRYRATKVRTWRDSRYDYRQTDFYSVVRGGSIAFDNIPADGSSKMPDALMESLEPFDLSKAADFRTAYLAGYLADKYDVDDTQCAGRATARLRESTERAFAETTSEYASARAESVNIQLRDGTVKYGLLPVWVLQTKWKDRNYTFAMNGQTGKFVGDLPMSKGLFAKWFLLLTLAAAAISYAVLYLIWFL